MGVLTDVWNSFVWADLRIQPLHTTTKPTNASEFLLARTNESNIIAIAHPSKIQVRIKRNSTPHSTNFCSTHEVNGDLLRYQYRELATLFRQLSADISSEGDRDAELYDWLNEHVNVSNLDSIASLVRAPLIKDGASVMNPVYDDGGYIHLSKCRPQNRTKSTRNTGNDKTWKCKVLDQSSFKKSLISLDRNGPGPRSLEQYLNWKNPKTFEKFYKFLQDGSVWGNEKEPTNLAAVLQSVVDIGTIAHGMQAQAAMDIVSLNRASVAAKQLAAHLGGIVTPQGVKEDEPPGATRTVDAAEAAKLPREDHISLAAADPRKCDGLSEADCLAAYKPGTCMLDEEKQCTNFDCALMKDQKKCEEVAVGEEGKPKGRSTSLCMWEKPAEGQGTCKSRGDEVATPWMYKRPCDLRNGECRAWGFVLKEETDGERQGIFLDSIMSKKAAQQGMTTATTAADMRRVVAMKRPEKAHLYIPHRGDRLDKIEAGWATEGAESTQDDDCGRPLGNTIVHTVTTSNLEVPTTGKSSKHKVPLGMFSKSSREINGRGPYEALGRAFGTDLYDGSASFSGESGGGIPRSGFNSVSITKDPVGKALATATMGDALASGTTDDPSIVTGEIGVGGTKKSSFAGDGESGKKDVFSDANKANGGDVPGSTSGMGVIALRRQGDLRVKKQDGTREFQLGQTQRAGEARKAADVYRPSGSLPPYTIVRQPTNENLVSSEAVKQKEQEKKSLANTYFRKQKSAANCREEDLIKMVDDDMNSKRCKNLETKDFKVESKTRTEYLEVLSQIGTAQNKKASTENKHLVCLRLHFVRDSSLWSDKNLIVPIKTSIDNPMTNTPRGHLGRTTKWTFRPFDMEGNVFPASYVMAELLGNVQNLYRTSKLAKRHFERMDSQSTLLEFYERSLLENAATFKEDSPLEHVNVRSPDKVLCMSLNKNNIDVLAGVNDSIYKINRDLREQKENLQQLMNYGRAVEMGTERVRSLMAGLVQHPVMK